MARPAAVFCRWLRFVAVPALALLLGSELRAQNNLPPEIETKVAPGIEALKSGDLDRAERVFSDALRHGLRHALIFHNLGVIAQQRGNHQQAIARFQEALALEPNYGPTRLLMGSSLLALGKSTQALKELKQAARLMPQESQVHLQLAKGFDANGDRMGVVEEFQRLVDLAPHEPEYAYQLGKAWTKLSQWTYQRIARLNPDAARLHQALGQEYVIQGKYDQALVAYREAARSDPKLPEIHLAIALILLELRKPEEAAREIELELKLAPESKAAMDAKAKIDAAK